MEGRLISLDSDDNWLLVDSSVKILRISGSDESSAGNSSLDSQRSIVIASTVAVNEGIILLRLKTVLFNILKSLGGKSTIATIATSSVTIKDLLFRERS